MRLPGSCGLLALAVLVLGCGPARNDLPPSAALPQRPVVGPVPGPQTNRPQPANPYAKDAVAQQAGRRLFIEMNCYGCHGGHAGGGMGPSLRDPVWIYGSSDAHIFDSVASGRAHGMPAWGTRLSDDQIWKLVSYIQTLGTPGEADPPPKPVVPKG